MQLKEVKISNILSFPHVPHFKNSPGISFSVDGSCNGTSILIGDNASGKTNFLRILEEFYANYINNYSYHREFLDNKKKRNQTIQQEINKTRGLETNYNTPSQDSFVELTIKLTEFDYENIGFVCKYPDQINAIIKKYSDFDIHFEKKDLQKLMEEGNLIQIFAKFDEKEQTFSLVDTFLTENQKFILKVFRYHQLLQIVITIFNQVEKKPEERKRYLLKNTVSIMGNDRVALEFRNFLNPVTLIGNSFSFRNSLAGYINFVHKIWSILEDFSQDQLLSSPTEIISFDDSMQYLRSTQFFLSINKIIRKYFRKELAIEYINEVIDIKLLDKEGRVFYFEDLSDGEQSLLALIFGFFGNDLEKGCMVINEPELHIHPFIQKGLVKVLGELAEKMGTQFIITTNSPLFINDKNITNVYRVFKNSDSKGSQIIAPKIVVDTEDAKLMHMLKFENLSKIFFVEKIIMVEGDTDAYFFSYYLEHLSKDPEWEDKITDFEIININGKGGFKPWRKFLNKFQIKNYFIGDWDNTVDYGFFTQAEINRYYQIANQQKRTSQRINYQDYYNKLVKTIMTFNPGKHKAILQGIEKMYQDQIYILKEGAIESYVPLERKGFPYMVSFCNSNFEWRLEDPRYQAQIKELNAIIEHIFSA